MMTFAQKIDDMIEPLRKLARCVGAPLYDLAARLFIANVFWTSGMARFRNLQNDTFDTQIFLFDMEHPVPGLAPEIAAYITVGAELILPILLALGLFGRVGAAGVLIMTAVIEFTYTHAADHILWAFLAGTIFIKGPGKISLDYLLVKYLRKEKS